MTLELPRTADDPTGQVAKATTKKNKKRENLELRVAEKGRSGWETAGYRIRFSSRAF